MIDTSVSFLWEAMCSCQFSERVITLQQAFFKGNMDIKGDVLLALRMNNLVKQR